MDSVFNFIDFRLALARQSARTISARDYANQAYGALVARAEQLIDTDGDAVDKLFEIWYTKYFPEFGKFGAREY